MANDEQIRQQVRQKLNVEKVKLWERPYTLEDGTKGSRPEVYCGVIVQQHNLYTVQLREKSVLVEFIGVTTYRN
jgi:hypothetical protein